MAQEPNQIPLIFDFDKIADQGIVPAQSTTVMQSQPQANFSLDPAVQQELTDALVKGQRGIREQVGTAEAAARKAGKVQQDANARLIETVTKGQEANELDYLGKLEKAKLEDAGKKTISETQSVEIMNAILGGEQQEAARDLAAASRNYDLFVSTRKNRGPLDIVGNFVDKRTHNKLAGEFNRALERYQALQGALQTSAATVSAQAKANAELQPTAPNKLEQEAFVLANDAKASAAKANLQKAGAKESVDTETAILNFRKAGMAGIQDFLNTYSNLITTSNAGVDLEMRSLQLRQLRAVLAEAAATPEVDKLILANTGATSGQLATFNTEQRKKAILVATNSPLVENVADLKEIEAASSVVDIHPNGMMSYLFKQIAPTINAEATKVQTQQEAMAGLTEDKKKAAEKEGSRNREKYQNFVDEVEVEFVDVTGNKEKKTTSQWAADRFIYDPAGQGIAAYHSSYADDYVLSKRPGASVIHTIRENIVDGNIKPGQLLDLQYWRAAAKDDAVAMYDAMQFIREQVVNNTPWKFYGLKAPRGDFQVTYGARFAKFLPYKQVSKSINSPEDVVKMFAEMDNVKAAEAMLEKENKFRNVPPTTMFPSGEEAKVNAGAATIRIADQLFGDNPPQRQEQKQE